MTMSRATAPAESSLRYRRDIDGLRALAVTAVLLFHVDPALVPGGFVGVDVFFVISGFLITSILLRRIEDRTFSFGWFYLRRIRRIAPAYFLVTLTTLVAGCLLLLPEDLRELGESALWSSFSVPNVFFWLHLDAGYFAADTRQVPLLHLWSLGVEEQFYLIWPLLLLIAWRYLPHAWVRVLLAALIVVSFAHAQRISMVDPAYAYYMLPTRAGELGLGAMLAMLPVRNPGSRFTRAWNETMAIVGFILVLGTMFLLHKGSHFPGWNAFIPCLGTALLISSGSSGRCATTAPLRWAPVVWVGLISYALYLWHWPVLAFIRYYTGDLTPGLATGAVVVAVLLASLSFHFVECPARNNKLEGRTQFVLLFAAPAILVAIVSGVVAVSAGSIRSHAPTFAGEQMERKLMQETAPAYEYPDNCQLGSFDPHVLENPRCVHGRGEAGPSVLLWGDSHAAHHIGIIGPIAEQSGFRVRNASYSTCPPVWSEREDYGAAGYREGCYPFRSLIQDAIGEYSTIILAANWNAHVKRRHFLSDLERTIDEMIAQGKSVVLLGQVPSFRNYDRSCMARNLRNALVDCVEIATRPDEGVAPANQVLQRLAAERPGVDYMDIGDSLCRNGTCSPYLDGRAVYFDASHLSMEGSWRIGRQRVSTHALVPGSLRAR